MERLVVVPLLDQTQACVEGTPVLVLVVVTLAVATVFVLVVVQVVAQVVALAFVPVVAMVVATAFVPVVAQVVAMAFVQVVATAFVPVVVLVVATAFVPVVVQVVALAFVPVVAMVVAMAFVTVVALVVAIASVPVVALVSVLGVVLVVVLVMFALAPPAVHQDLALKVAPLLLALEVALVAHLHAVLQIPAPFAPPPLVPLVLVSEMGLLPSVLPLLKLPDAPIVPTNQSFKHQGSHSSLLGCSYNPMLYFHTKM